MSVKIRFTKKAIQELPSLDKRKRYYDTDVAGLICDVSPKGKKVFRVYKRIRTHSSPLSITLGTFPDMTIEMARTAARESLNCIASRQNPNLEKRYERYKAISMEEVAEHYFESKELSVSTRRGYKQVLTCYLEKYSLKPMLSFNEADVKTTHKEISMRSKAQADLCMRFVRALFNFAKYEYRDDKGKSYFEENPVHILSHLRLWNHVGRKQTYLNSGQLSTFLNAVDAIRDESEKVGNIFPVSVCDYIETALFTGLRKTELVLLEWAHVDMDESSFWVERTKNGDPLKLPMSKHLKTIFERRFRFRTESKFVFNAVNNLGRIIEPKKVLHKISDRAELKFSLHDLRRTYTTVAERIQTGTYTLKRLLNHKSGRNDVTAGYTILTPEELREPAQRIENKILQLAGRQSEEHLEDPKNVLELEKLSNEEKVKLAQYLLASL